MAASVQTDAHDWRVLWAKSSPRHPLWKHMFDAAALSLALPPLHPDAGLSAAEVAFFVGLHDVGKANPVFQHKARELSDEIQAAGYPVTADADLRHERFSWAFVQQLLGGRMNRRHVDAIALAIAAHHSHWDVRAYAVSGVYQRAQSRLATLLREILGVTELPSSLQGNVSAFGITLTGRVVLCDWVVSDERYMQDERLAGVDEPGRYFERTLEVAREWVGELGFDRVSRPSRPESVVEQPRPIQHVLLEEDIPPGLVIIEAPMGEGKTEAAWILAEKWVRDGYAGMYMALPTMATSDALHRRYRDDYLGKLGDASRVKLVHGMAWLRDATEPESALVVGETAEDSSSATAWFRPTRRAMLAAHGVGTIDQAMLAGMNTRFGFLRLYGLGRRVLVIDEVHAYDAYMSTIIRGLLQWCSALGIPVILLSATLSAAQRWSMVQAYGALGETTEDDGADTPYPLISVTRPGSPVRRIHASASSERRLLIEGVSGALGDPTEAAKLATELVERGGCCCVIVNTVRQAQEVYQALRLAESEKSLFHARFKAIDRSRIADRVSCLFGKDRAVRPQRFVLVATQVVEQSLDVDFDHMISEVAPVDLLLQRSGRLHRHTTRDTDPVLHVLLPEQTVRDFGGTGYVYAAKPLLRTLAILGRGGRREVLLPDDFRDLIERCYGTSEWQQDTVPWDVVREADAEWQAEAASLQSHARQFLLGQPRPDRFKPVDNMPVGDDSDDGDGWRASTRLGANDSTVLMVPEHEMPDTVAGELSMDEVRVLYQQTARLPGYLQVGSPAEGYQPAQRAKGRLRGLLVLPVDADGVWKGAGGRGGGVEVRYDNTLGLVIGRSQ